MAKQTEKTSLQRLQALAEEREAELSWAATEDGVHLTVRAGSHVLTSVGEDAEAAAKRALGLADAILPAASVEESLDA